MQLPVAWGFNCTALHCDCWRAHADAASVASDILGLLIHQVMEAATVLLSQEVCLDPSLPPEQRAVADTPPLPEV